MKSIALGLSAAMATLALETAAWAQGGPGQGWMWDHGWGWGGMMGGGIGMILFWGLVILLIVLAVRGVGGFGGKSEPPSPTPLQILQERYARGEIDKEEYEERRKALGG